MIGILIIMTIAKKLTENLNVPPGDAHLVLTHTIVRPLVTPVKRTQSQSGPTDNFI